MTGRYPDGMAKVVVERRESETSGKVSYRVRFVDPQTGKMRHHATYRKKTDADRARAKLRTQLESGTWFDDRDGRKMTLRTWCDEWALRSSHRRSSTAERDELVLRTYWLPELGDYPLANVTPFMVTGVVAKMQQHLAEGSVRTNVEVLARVMKGAVEHALIQKSPVAAVKGVRRAPQRSEDIRFLSVTELRTLADKIRPEYRIGVWLAGVGGLRWSEVVGLRRGRIDFETGRLHIVETTTESVNHVITERTDVKSTAGRRWIPMPQLLIDELRAHLEARVPDDPDALVMVGPDGGPPMRSWHSMRVFQPAVTAAGLDGLTFHSLRHSCAGFLIEAKVHPELLRKWMGHADIRTTLSLYGRVSDDTFVAAAADLQGLLVPKREDDVEG